jgi:hypothetical protein
MTAQIYGHFDKRSIHPFDRVQPTRRDLAIESAASFDLRSEVHDTVEDLLVRIGEMIAIVLRDEWNTVFGDSELVPFAHVDCDQTDNVHSPLRVGAVQPNEDLTPVFSTLDF